MRHLELTEGGPPQSIDLTSEEADAISCLELAVATRTFVPGVWEIAATSKIGVARIGDLQVTVRPKLGIHRLIFLMGYAQSPNFWRDWTVELDPAADLFSAVADAFARQAVRALDQGLLHGYQTVEESLPVLRGRVREAEQISRRFARMIPLEVRYDDFTADIAENQVLLAAVHRLLGLPGLSRAARRTLLRLRLQLADVTPLARGSQLPRWQPSRLNARYQPALRFAELILSANSFEQRIGSLAVTGFVFDMWRIFEDFVCVALREAMARYGGRSELQHRTHLDEAEAVAMRPDYVWSRGGAIRVVADAKYKAEKPAGFPQADLYQLLAYCTVLGLADGHLIYAKGEEVTQVHSIKGSPVRIHCHTLDLAAMPVAILGQVSEIAGRLQRIRAPG
jgi:5-methylcytosine-specific restriction enzyme subunit McrC